MQNDNGTFPTALRLRGKFIFCTQLGHLLYADLRPTFDCTPPLTSSLGGGRPVFRCSGAPYTFGRLAFHTIKLAAVPDSSVADTNGWAMVAPIAICLQGTAGKQGLH
jgi:hypothetical protein